MVTSKELKRFKESMKRHPTASEAIAAMKMDIEKIEYKRQVIVGFFIVDFLVTKKMLVIEIDGDSHNSRKHYDERRDDYLKKCGFHILRIKNKDVDTYDFSKIKRRKNFEERSFRSGIGKAQSLKSSYMLSVGLTWRYRKRGAGKQQLLFVR